MADTMVLPPCSGLYVGKKRVAVGARQRYAGEGALGSPLAWVAGRVRAEERGLCIVGRRVRSVVWPRRMAYKPSDPDRSAER